MIYFIIKQYKCIYEYIILYHLALNFNPLLELNSQKILSLFILIIMKINLGYGISLPINYKKDIPEYAIEDFLIIKNLSKKFNTIQVMFTKNKLNNEEINNIKNIIKNYKNIFVHASYQINMGADLIPSKTDLYNTGIEILLNEICYAIKINAKGIVLHTCKNVQKKYDDNYIYNNMVKFIIELFKKMKALKYEIDILIETPVGQGGEMLWNIDEFLDFITSFKNLYFYNKLNICIDTCHIYQAGYDLNNDNIINKLHSIFKHISNKIKLIHLNDSYHQVGQHIDRHEQIGEGYIQINNLIKFIRPYIKIPFILETKPPYEKQIKNINKYL